MPISKKKQAKKAASKAFIKEQREEMLAKVGYLDLKRKHGKSLGPQIPSYKVESKHELSQRIPPNGLKVKSGAHHPDAMHFPVYEGHKSNPVLQINFDGKQYSGGKKT